VEEKNSGVLGNVVTDHVDVTSYQPISIDSFVPFPDNLQRRLNTHIAEVKAGNQTTSTLIADYNELEKSLGEEEYEGDNQIGSIVSLFVAWMDSMTTDSNQYLEKILTVWFGVELITPVKLTVSILFFLDMLPVSIYFHIFMIIQSIFIF